MIVSTRHARSEFGLGAFWLMRGSAFGATAHDAFMTLPAYTRTRAGEVQQLGSGLNPCQLGRCVKNGSLEEHKQR